jgi:hypothetical protein
MLADALVERYSRQILLPEVGGRGQERLCATTATVTGRGMAAAVAARLLDAAGVAVVLRDADGPTVNVTIGERGVVRARDGVVATLVGRPCVACADGLWKAGGDTRDHDAAAAQAFGAVIAAEAIRVALGLVRVARVHTIDVAGGAFAARSLEPTAGCAACPTTP